MSEKENTTPYPFDYNSLKEFGLKYIQKIANKNWTDFNVHDPGVTILEALCLGLTDLAYRTNFDIKDLLTKKEGNKNSGALFRAEEIFSSNPSTIDEYRKLILEHLPFVKNVWITTAKKREKLPSFNDDRKFLKNWDFIEINGYYDIKIEVDRTIIPNAPCCDDNDVKDYDTRAIHAVRNLFYSHRNMCEDLLNVTVLPEKKICLDVDLVLASNADFKKVVADIYNKVSEYISPGIRRYTLPELIKKGRKPEEIYRGCLPSSTFVDFEELINFKRRTCFYRSDIIQIIKGIEGVENVAKLEIWVDGSIPGKKKDILDVDAKFAYYLEKFDYEKVSVSIKKPSLATTDSTRICFTRNGINYNVELNKETSSSNEEQQEPIPTQLDESLFSYPVAQGRYRNSATYNSFQHLFPTVYRMGTDEKAGLITEDDDVAKLQLKAYLTFFDQFLADYLAQLDSLNKYFSIEDADSEVLQTYYFKNLTDDEIVEVSKVLKEKFPYRNKYCYHTTAVATEDAAEGLKEENKVLDKSEEYVGAETLYYERRNRLMDHLLARFNESFAEYAVLLFISDKDNVAQYSAFLKEGSKDKSHILCNYPSLSANRFSGVIFSNNLQLSGLELKILSRLGINNPKPKMASAYKVLSEKEYENIKEIETSELFEKYFGIHIIEHINLIPAKGLDDATYITLFTKKGENCVKDPYTFRATVLLPGYLDKDDKYPNGIPEFRRYVEEVVKEEFPAHVAPIIGWVETVDEMAEAEAAYEKLVDIMSELNHRDSNWEDRQYAALAKYIDILIKVKVFYPETTEIVEELVPNPPIVIEVHPPYIPKPKKYADVNEEGESSQRKGFTTNALLKSLRIPRYITLDQGYHVEYKEVVKGAHTELEDRVLRLTNNTFIKLIEKLDAQNDNKE